MGVNKDLNFKWKVKTGQYQNGKGLYLNKICVGGCDWNSSRSKGDTEPNRYVGYLSLPSLKFDRTFGDSEDEVKAKVERVVSAWFNEALRVK